MCLHRRVVLLAGLVSTGIGAVVAAEPASKEIEVNGITMPYVEEGTGEPVVFVHGAVSDSRVWEPLRQEFSDDHRFIAPTLRYFGAGDWPDEGENFGIATHADDVAAFIEALDLGPVHLVGWSYGGTVATAVALERPDLIASLILYEPTVDSMIQDGEAGEAARREAGRMFGPVTAAMQEGDVEEATRLLIEGVLQMEPGGFESQPPEARELQMANARTMPLIWSAAPWEASCEMLQQFEGPTLIVLGERTSALWSHIAEAMDECLPQAEVAILPGVNHDGPVRDPAGLARMIEDFVASH